MKPRRSLLLAWLAISALGLLWARAGAVLAHAVLVSSSPAPNAILDTAPAQIRILFSEPVVPAFSRILVFAQSGQQVDNGDLTSDNSEGAALGMTLPPLPDGTYLVSWEALSAVDGHTTSGAFPFGVGVNQLAPPPGLAPSTAQELTPLSAGARWLNLTGLALLLGLFTFRTFVWNPSFHAAELDEADAWIDLDFVRSALRLGSLALALIGAGLALTLIVQASQFDGLNFENVKTWLGTRFGVMWLVRFWLAVAAGFALADLSAGLREDRSRDEHAATRRSWVWTAGLGCSLVLVLTTSAASHSAAVQTVEVWEAFISAVWHFLLIHSLAAQPPALTVDFIHVLAAGVWAGGLAHLGLALWKARRLPAGPRAWLNLSLALNFSALAAGAVGVLLVSGAYLGWKHVDSWTALFGTAYGLVLLAKIALALPAFGIAGVNLLIIKPRLDAVVDDPEGSAALQTQRCLEGLARAEAVFALLVLAATGLLTDLQRGQDAPRLAGRPGAVTLTQTAGNLQVTLTVEPALVGQNTFDVFLTDAGGQPVTTASEVSLRFTFLGQTMGAAKAEAAPLGDGRYRLNGGYVSVVGPWQIEAAVRRTDAFDTFAAFRVEADLSGVIRPSGGDARPIERLAGFLTRSGGSVTGTFLVLFGLAWGFLAARAASRDWQFALLMTPGAIALVVGGLQLFTFLREFTPAKFAANPILPDAASIARGQELYTAHCAACHGTEGRGDGPAAGLSPRPTDFTAGHTDTHPDGDLYYWIKEGIPNSAMRGFAGQLNDDDLWRLVNYIRRLSAQASPP